MLNADDFTTTKTNARLEYIKRAVESMMRLTTFPQTITGQYVVVDCHTEERAKAFYTMLKEVLEGNTNESGM